jgi:hypothetical protein
MATLAGLGPVLPNNRGQLQEFYGAAHEAVHFQFTILLLSRPNLYLQPVLIR